MSSSAQREVGEQLPERVRIGAHDWWDLTEYDHPEVPWAEISYDEFDEWLAELGFTGRYEKKIIKRKRIAPELFSNNNITKRKKRRNGDRHGDLTGYRRPDNNSDYPPVEPVPMHVRKGGVKFLIQTEGCPTLPLFHF